MFIIRKIVLFIAFGLVLTSLKAQIVPTVYVHTDKAAYFPGDTVWFKAYILTEGLLDSNIRNLYIDWGDSQEQIIEHNVYLVSDGVAPCQFVIPTNYPEMELNLNAYTASLAENRQLAYFKSIPILQQVSASLDTVSNIHMLSMYPEGGALLQNVTNRMVIRSYERNGLAVPTYGKVIDERGNELVKFETDGQGLAEVEIVGSDRERRIIWYTPNGQELWETVPKAQKEGHTLRVKELLDTVYVSVLSASQHKDLNERYTLSCRLDNLKVFEKQFSIGYESPQVVKFPKKGLKAGVLQFFLLDDVGMEISQRALMIGIEDIVLIPEISIEEFSKAGKGRNRFTVSLPDGEKASLSVSITDVEVPVDTMSNIIDGILWSPMSLDRIQNSYTYFKLKDSSNSLELFVQINSWRSDFSVVDCIQSVSEEGLLYLKGKVNMKGKSFDRFNQRLQRNKEKSASKGKMVRGASFGYRALQDKTMLYKEVFLDERGKFEVKDLAFFDSLEVRFTQVYREVKFMPFDVEYSFLPMKKPRNLFMPDWKYTRPVKYNFADKEWDYAPWNYKDEYGGIRLKAVEIRKKWNPRLDRLNKRYGGGNPSFAFDIQNDQRAIMVTSVYEYLDKMIPGLTFNALKGSADRYHKPDFKSFHYKKSDVKILFMNFRKGRMGDNLNMIDMSEIAYIAFYEPDPPRHRDSRLYIYKFSPDDVNHEFGRQLDFQIVGGYVGIKPFYHPVFQTEEQKADDEYNDRSTLYWYPLLEIGAKKNNGEVIFYNNDKARGYWITIQGVTNTGKLVHYQKMMK